jgi:cupin 2 domain-containing protein
MVFRKDFMMPGNFEIQNVFTDIPDDLTHEFLETLTETKNIRIERIVSRGHVSPPDFWYDQTENEYVLLLQGSAVLRFKDKKDSMVLHPGDHVTVPKHAKHRVEWTDPDRDTVWLAVFYG